MSKNPITNAATDYASAKECGNAASSSVATRAFSPCIMGKYQGRYTNRRGGITNH